MGVIIDGGEVLTYNNTKQDQDWYAVTLAKPAAVGRVVFLHSWAFPSGGWFDTSAGKTTGASANRKGRSLDYGR